MKKIFIFSSIIVLLTPLSVEAKTPDTLVLEETRFPEATTLFQLRVKEETWSLQAGALRLRAKKESDLHQRVIQRKESSPRLGIALVLKF